MRNRISIQQHGLVPQIRRYEHIDRRAGIFLLETLEQARDWAYWESVDGGGRWDIWQVELPGSTVISADPAVDMNDVYDSWVVYDPIPPERCQLLMTQPRFRRGSTMRGPAVQATKVPRD